MCNYIEYILSIFIYLIPVPLLAYEDLAGKKHEFPLNISDSININMYCPSKAST